ncbi:MAG: GNAT family N-acetyltransferase [Rhodoferax sp.]|nr:GNAT family N-acetyltransferase [Rhodoferax sp.]
MSDQVLAVYLMAERCAIRPAQVSDLQALTEAVSHPKWPAALPLSDFYRNGELPSWLDRMCQRNKTSDSAVWAIDLLSGESSIGQVSLIARPQDHVLSFWLSPSYWGSGLAREAVTKVLEHVLSAGAVKRVWAATALWNEQSAKLMLDVGFTEGPVLENGYTANGTSHAVRQFHLQSHMGASCAPTEA